MSAIDDVLSRLQGVKRNGSGWLARCPAHEDHNPSLSVNEGEGGRVLLKCFAGCEYRAILAALGLEASTPESAEETPSAWTDRDRVRHEVTERYRYVDEAGQVLFIVCRTVDKQFPAWNPKLRRWRLGDARRVLYRLPQIMAAVKAGSPVFVVEGEKDCHSLERLGFAATTSPGGAGRGKWKDAYSDSLTGARVVILPDNDEPGRAHAAAVAASLRRKGIARAILDVASHMQPGADVSDAIAQGMTAEYLAAAAEEALAAEAKAPAGCGPGPVVVCMADVAAQAVRWLWPLRIPFGMLTLIAGDPGLGKSFLALHLAASCSQIGTRWPDGYPTLGPLSTVLLTAEDALAYTVRPRLDTLGADVSRIHALTSCQDETGKLYPFALAQDLALLREAVDRTSAQLVIVDPLNAYLTGVDSHVAAEVRFVLAELSRVADETGAAVVVIHHLNKGSTGANALYRATGSLDFVAAARAYHVVARDKQDEERRLFLPAKLNLARMPAGLAYRIADAGLVWEDEPVELSASDALREGSASDEERSALAEAESFLLEELAAGPVAAKEMKAKARAAGIAERTLMRAKASVHVTSAKDGFQGLWTWSLPDEERQRMPKDATVPPPGEVAPFASFEDSAPADEEPIELLEPAAAATLWPEDEP
jgi:5S rRNA maturation endonuclease (ribonuclease M5)/archaellum biogenesis ATPase FlaH